MNTIKWGIIGCGDVAEVKSGPAFYKSENSELVAVMRRDGEKAEDYAKRHNVPKWYNDADKLINDPEVDAVYVATPPDTHAYYTIKTAEAGKSVYVEKPMALNYGECQAMINSCANAGVKLFVGYYRRMLPAFLKVKDLLDEGSIGEIQFINIKLLQPPQEADFNNENLPWRILPEIAGGGYFYDLASHQFDFLDYLFGPVREVSGRTDNLAGLYRAEDYVNAEFKFESGVLGTGLWSFSVFEKDSIDLIEIYGDKGKISFSTFDKAIPVRVSGSNGEKMYHEEFPEHVHQPLVETVIADLLGKGICPSTGISGARTNWVMDKILSKI